MNTSNKSEHITTTDVLNSCASRPGQAGGQQDSLLNKKYWTDGDREELVKIIDHYLKRHFDEE
jgi:hypothetical protein